MSWTDRIYYLERRDAFVHFEWIHDFCYVSELTNELPEWTTTYRSKDFHALLREYAESPTLLYQVETWDDR